VGDRPLPELLGQRLAQPRLEGGVEAAEDHRARVDDVDRGREAHAQRPPGRLDRPQGVAVAHNYGQILEVCDRINLLQHGSITFDKPTSETSVQELTDLVVAEYRAARTQKLRPDPSANARPTPRP
jgi:hypothetical protein